MKRFRVKLAGFVLAVLAGSAVAADNQWLGDAPTPQTDPVWNRPSGVRQASASEPAASGPIWLPASKSSTTTGTFVAPATRTASAPIIEVVRPVVNPVSLSKPGIDAVAEDVVAKPEFAKPMLVLPTIPSVESAAPLPGIPDEIWRGYQASQAKPTTSDSPVQPARPMTPPTLPDSVRPQSSDLLPVPRPVGPVTAPASTELPVAPPELMLPDCTPGKHGAFGSSPIRLSRDYPSLSELCGTPVRDWFVSRFAGDREAGSAGFLQAEYLLWWMPGLRIPTLATTNPIPNSTGFLGEPGTAPILGPGTMIGSMRQGFRVRGGLWLDDCWSCGIDGSIFVLGRRTADATLSSSQFGLITRPVFSPNIQPGIGFVGETGEAVTVPGVLAGGLTAHAESFLWGADANIRHSLMSGCDWKLMGFLGYRFLSLSEKLSVQENILVTGASPRVTIPDPIGTTIFVRDSFETRNRFNGGQVGATFETRRGRWDLDTRASIAFGVTSQELDINGFQVRARPGQLPTVFQGGLLAVGPNLGRFTRDRFSVVPEVMANIGYWITPNLKAFVGYNFIYWTNVIRPGDQIDRTVDLSFVPNAPPTAPSGQLRPKPLFNQSDLWISGVQFGVQWRW